MVAILALIFIVAPIVELAVIVVVAGKIGIFETLGLLILLSVVGAWVCKREGLAVFRRLQQTLADGGIPHKEVVDGFLILLGGALLLAPGFVSDVFGLLLLLPPVRIAVRSMLLGSFRRRSAFAIRLVDGAGRRVDLGRNNGVHDVTARDASARDARPRPPGNPELPS
jgi:UPF0716 protein FxsA